MHAYTSIEINMLLNDACMKVDTLTRITVKIPFSQFVAWLTFSDYRYFAKQPRGRIHSPVQYSCHNYKGKLMSADVYSQKLLLYNEADLYFKSKLLLYIYTIDALQAI